MLQPKVSVIIPCYNSERFLRECLDSVVGQTLHDIEIICVDDGATDSTPDILCEYAEQDDRIRILTQENQYAGVARNNGMDVATGKYLSFLDSDDFFEPVMLEKMYDKCEEDVADICVCSAGEYDMATKRVSFPKDLRPELNVLPLGFPFSAKDIPKHVFTFCNTVPWNKLFRAEFIKSHSLRYPQIELAEDACFTRSALAIAKKITVVDQIFVYYRRGVSDSLIESNRDSYASCVYQALMHLKESFVQYGVFEEYEESFFNAALSGCGYAMSIAKTKKWWLQTALFIKDKLIPDFGLLEHPKSVYRWQAAYDTMSFLVNSSYEELEQFEPELRQDETTVHINDPAQDFPLDNSLKVSVIIPVYNTEKYVEECIRSVIRQNLQDIEIIVIDDGSTDKSLEIIERIANEDERVIILSQENQGQSVARNYGLRHAKGEFILFLDSDDLLVWCALEHLYRQAKYHRIDELLYEGVSFYDTIELYRDYPWYYTAYTYKDDYSEPLTGRELMAATVENGEYYVMPGVRLFNRAFLKDNKILFPERIILEDNIFALRTLNAAKRAWVHKEPLYLRRVRPESTMTAERGWRNLYGYYACLLEVEQMLSQEKTEFKSTLEKLRKMYRNQVMSAFLAIPESDRLNVDERPEFSSKQHHQALLPLLISSLQREAEYEESEKTYKQKVEAYGVKDKTNIQRITEYKARVEVYSQRIEAHQQRIEAYKVKEETYKEKIAAQKTKEESYKQKLTAQKTKQDSYTQRIDDLRAREENYKQKIDTLRTREENYKQKITQLKSKEEIYKQKLDDIYCSRSWKLARIISAPIRMLRGIVSGDR